MDHGLWAGLATCMRMHIMPCLATPHLGSPLYAACVPRRNVFACMSIFFCFDFI